MASPKVSKLMEQIVQKHKLLSIPNNQPLPGNISHVGGDRSYMLLGSLSKLEKALMKWTLSELVSKHKFVPVVVPNILYDHIIERCGFPTRSKQTQVYKISGTSAESMHDEQSPLANDNNKSLPCMAGTSEFALAALHIGDTIPSKELPKKYCAMSRCYRAETSRSATEWGLYRVHYFNKVEMFAFTTPDQSATMHQEFLSIQESIFKQLDLRYRVLDMPEDDLGLSAKKKYDIEAWMSGRNRFGEISSTSNCQDYQSSRLNISHSQMVERDGQLQIEKNFVHTVNGTACSSIRTLIAMCEQHQTDDGRVMIPQVLVPFMNGETHLPTKLDEQLLASLDISNEITKS